MLAHLGPALTQGTDLITQAVGAWTLAALAAHGAGHAGCATPLGRRIVMTCSCSLQPGM
jgi:hypothetical protein